MSLKRHAAGYYKDSGGVFTAHIHNNSWYVKREGGPDITTYGGREGAEKKIAALMAADKAFVAGTEIAKTFDDRVGTIKSRHGDQITVEIRSISGGNVIGTPTTHVDSFIGNGWRVAPKKESVMSEDRKIILALEADRMVPRGATATSMTMVESVDDDEEDQTEEDFVAGFPWSDQTQRLADEVSAAGDVMKKAETTLKYTKRGKGIASSKAWESAELAYSTALAKWQSLVSKLEVAREMEKRRAKAAYPVYKADQAKAREKAREDANKHTPHPNQGSLFGEAAPATKPKKIDSSMKSKIATDLGRAGLDGNGNFEKPGKGLNALSSVLTKYGIEFDDTPSLMGDEGRTTIRLAWSNPTDSMSPTSIGNNVVAFSWYKRDSGSFECLAYVS